jgi:uncharacterized coiled-coil protein SlyX
MSQVIDELDNTLIEANMEASDQNEKVRAAKEKMEDIEILIDKGETFLTGLKGLFGIDD